MQRIYRTYTSDHHNQGFQAGSMREMFSTLADSLINVVTLDSPPSNSARSTKRLYVRTLYKIF